MNLETAAENATPENDDSVGLVPRQEVNHVELAPSLTLSQYPQKDIPDTAGTKSHIIKVIVKCLRTMLKQGSDREKPFPVFVVILM